VATLKYIADINLMTVTLDSAYTAADGHMHLTAGHGARLPATGDFWLRTTTGTYRCFKVTARSTDDITVTAAQDGTSDGNLDAGQELKWVLGATALDQLKLDIVNSDVTRLTILRRANVQSIGTGAWTTVSWETEVQDDVSAFDAGSPTVVTVPTGFTKVRVTVYTHWASNATGVRYDAVRYDGAAVRLQTLGAHQESNKCWITGWLTVVAAKTLDLQVIQTSGGNLNLGVGTEIQFEWRQ
jgi:hypothetical protein